MKKISFLMLFALSFLVLNCRTEEFHNEEVNHQKQFQVSMLSRQQVGKITPLWNKISEIKKNKLTHSYKLSSKSVQDSILEGAIIDTDHVLLVQNGEHKTYTFPVHRSFISNKTESLLLKQNADETFTGILIQYDIDSQERQRFINGENINISSKTKIYDIESININTNARVQVDVVGCYQITWETGWCSAGVHQTGQDSSCQVGGAPAPYIQSVVDICDTGSSTPSAPSGFLGIGSSGSFTPIGGGYLTVPFVSIRHQYYETEDPNDPNFTHWLNVGNYFNSLPSQLNQLRNTNPDIFYYTYYYFKDNGINLSTTTFITERLTGLYNWYTAANNNPNNSSAQNQQSLNWAFQYLLQDPTISWTEFEPIVTFANKFLQENPDTLNPEAIFLRFKSLSDALLQNPNKLLKIPCNQLPHWQDIAMHQIPQSVKIKLQNIPNQNSYWSSWNITNLDNGEGAHINMDLFPVKISTMPKKPNSTQKYTPAEFFDFFRKNINLFAEKFTPIENNYYNIHDTALWNSANPLGALIHIDITPDDGTVVCSGVSTNTWIFSTIKAPQGWSYDGVHPVSGNRAFSYYMDGTTMYIYTRGVDRTSKINDQKTPIINYIMEAIAFSAADDLWTEMQNKLSKYVNDREGSSNVITPVKYRPNYDGIKNYLKGKIPLSSVGCN